MQLIDPDLAQPLRISTDGRGTAMLLARAGDRRFPPSKLSVLLGVMTELGADPQEVLAGTGLLPESVSNPFTMTSCAQFLRASRNAVRLLPDADLGLRVGERLGVTHYGMYGYALLCSESLRQVWERAIRYHPLSGGMLPLRWEVQGDEAVWTFPERAAFPWPDVDEALYRFMIDLQLAAHVRIGQDVMGESFCPKQATYSGQAPADITHWERVLHAPVAFGQAANTLRFDATLLTRAPQLAHPITASHLSVQCARLLEEASWGAGMTRRVYEELTRHGGRFPSIEEVASRLCMTSRTLRRRLEAEGAGFSDLLAAVRKRLAIDYLVGTRMSTEDIAEALGFSDVVSFRHAFKRWTGLTPREYRLAQDGARLHLQ